MKTGSSLMGPKKKEKKTSNKFVWSDGKRMNLFLDTANNFKVSGRYQHFTIDHA